MSKAKNSKAQDQIARDKPKDKRDEQSAERQTPLRRRPPPPPIEPADTVLPKPRNSGGSLATPDGKAAPSKARPGRDYELGYGKPPVEHRFQPGECRNRGDRPKGSKDPATIAREIVEEVVTVRTANGKKKKMRRGEIWLRKQGAAADAGDPRAMERLFAHAGISRSPKGAEPPPEEQLQLEPYEKDILEEYTRQILEASRSPAEKDQADD